LKTRFQALEAKGFIEELEAPPDEYDWDYPVGTVARADGKLFVLEDNTQDDAVWREVATKSWLNDIAAVLDLASLKACPALWPLSTVMSFGNATYGIRWRGRITATAGTSVVTNLSGASGLVAVESFGGYWEPGVTNLKYPFPFNDGGNEASVKFVSAQTVLTTQSTQARSGSSPTSYNEYEFWLVFRRAS